MAGAGIRKDRSSCSSDATGKAPSASCADTGGETLGAGAGGDMWSSTSPVDRARAEAFDGDAIRSAPSACIFAGSGKGGGKLERVLSIGETHSGSGACGNSVAVNVENVGCSLRAQHNDKGCSGAQTEKSHRREHMVWGACVRVRDDQNTQDDRQQQR